MTICQKRDERCKCWCENIGRSLLKPEAKEWNDDFDYINSMLFQPYKYLVSCSACSDRDNAPALDAFYKFHDPSCILTRVLDYLKPQCINMDGSAATKLAKEDLRLAS